MTAHLIGRYAGKGGRRLPKQVCPRCGARFRAEAPGHCELCAAFYASLHAARPTT